VLLTTDVELGAADEEGPADVDVDVDVTVELGTTTGGAEEVTAAAEDGAWDDTTGAGALDGATLEATGSGTGAAEPTRCQYLNICLRPRTHFALGAL
jgi:hypothetical protein